MINTRLLVNFLPMEMEIPEFSMLRLHPEFIS